MRSMCPVLRRDSCINHNTGYGPAGEAKRKRGPPPIRSLLLKVSTGLVLDIDSLAGAPTLELEILKFVERDTQRQWRVGITRGYVQRQRKYGIFQTFISQMGIPSNAFPSAFNKSLIITNPSSTFSSSNLFPTTCTPRGNPCISCALYTS